MTDKINAFKNNIKDKKVSVIGIGVSNRPLIHFLAENGAVVTAHDKKTEQELGDAAQELKQKFRLIAAQSSQTRAANFFLITISSSHN